MAIRKDLFLSRLIMSPAHRPEQHSPPAQLDSSSAPSISLGVAHILEAITEALQKAERHHPLDPNEPSPEIFKAAVDLAWDAVHDHSLKAAYGNDPAAEPLFIQLQCTLKHVRFTFSRETELYVHEDVLRGPYSFLPSRSALELTQTLLSALETSPKENLAVHSKDAFEAEVRMLKARHRSFVTSLIRNSLSAWKNFRQRLQSGGNNTPFPELSDVVQYLYLYMYSEEVGQALRVSRVLSKLHEVAQKDLSRAKTKGFPYRETVDAIENAVAFLDIHARSTPSYKTPKLYHSHRYQYYTYFLKAQTPDHILLPIFEDVGATDLIAMRGVPIGFVGAHPETKWVDGFWQTPLEFWYHDVNHSRRIFQFFKEHAESTNVSRQALAEDSHHFIKHEVLPLIMIKKADSDATKKNKRMMKMILFEMFHEDAQVAVKSSAEKALLRAPNTLTPFEYILDGETRVVYTMEPGATILAYVYRKLAGNFYDVPDNRQEYICIADFRTQKNVALAGDLIAKGLDLKVRPEVNVAYAHNDAGLPDDFRMEVEKFMEENPFLMVPLSIAVRSTEEVFVHEGQRREEGAEELENAK